MTILPPPTLAITSPSVGQKFPINAGTLPLNAMIDPPAGPNTWVGCQTQRRVGSSWQSTFGPTNFPANSFPMSLPVSPGYFGQVGRYRIKCAVSGIGQESGWREFEIMMVLNPKAATKTLKGTGLGASQQDATSQPGGDQSKTSGQDTRAALARPQATDESARELTALAERLRGLGVNPEAKRLLTEVQTLQKGLDAKTGDPAALLARIKTLKEETTKLEASLRRLPKTPRPGS